MLEYKIITGTSEECQKKLNQWADEYVLKILQMCPRGGSLFEVTILLTREG